MTTVSDNLFAAADAVREARDLAPEWQHDMFNALFMSIFAEAEAAYEIELGI